MGAILGVVVGYVLGARSGDRGFDELRDAWKTISSSDEVKDMVAGGLSLAGDVLRQGRGILADRLAVPESSSGLHRVA